MVEPTGWVVTASLFAAPTPIDWVTVVLEKPVAITAMLLLPLLWSSVLSEGVKII